ncbi:MAG: anti-sigma factor antagonist [Dehalococcoidia bacterium]|nr:MAG: anti-sigma factor antagonist [Dehalococcoidia bacterium]
MNSSSIGKSTCLISLDRNLSGESEKGLKEILAKVEQQKIRHVILDFSPIDHMNSAGASVLVKMAVLANQHKQKLFALGLNTRYQDIFHLTGLCEGISVIKEPPEKSAGLSDAEVRDLQAMIIGKGRQDDGGWSPNLTKLQVTEKPRGAMNKNVHNRQVLGPLQGFGPIWEKTYRLTIDKVALQPKDIIAIMKQHFPEFQPPQNRFYATTKGITAGEIVLIDSATPGGLVSTGVLVLYSDDWSFTLMTPQGHPEAGWVTFNASAKGKAIEMQIQGLASAADPLYELAFRIAGSKFQEAIWRHVLSSLASHLGVKAEIRIEKTCLMSDLQWLRSVNLWYNAQIRSLPYNITRLFS